MDSSGRNNAWIPVGWPRLCTLRQGRSAKECFGSSIPSFVGHIRPVVSLKLWLICHGLACRDRLLVELYRTGLLGHRSDKKVC